MDRIDGNIPNANGEQSSDDASVHSSNQTESQSHFVRSTASLSNPGLGRATRTAGGNRTPAGSEVAFIRAFMKKTKTDPTVQATPAFIQATPAFIEHHQKLANHFQEAADRIHDTETPLEIPEGYRIPYPGYTPTDASLDAVTAFGPLGQLGNLSPRQSGLLLKRIHTASAQSPNFIFYPRFRKVEQGPGFQALRQTHMEKKLNFGAKFQGITTDQQGKRVLTFKGQDPGKTLLETAKDAAEQFGSRDGLDSIRGWSLAHEEIQYDIPQQAFARAQATDSSSEDDRKPPARKNGAG